MNEPSIASIPLVPVVLGVAVLALSAWAIVTAIVQIARSAELDPTERAIWVVAVLVAPIAGALAWYALGPHPFGIRIGRDLS